MRVIGLSNRPLAPGGTIPQALRGPLRALFAVAALAGLAACATQPQMDARTEAQTYLQHAARSYTPPGSATDPWGPYVVEASSRFDVPERWIREVMRVESGGHAFLNGQPITSGPGAMGLMQVMPGTYDELKAQYSLGDDPFDPHDNILAGAAYIRELYDLYGSPGFLAAYNGGPGRLDDYLTRNRPLPDETRRYVAMIAPYISDSAPLHRSPAEQYALNTMPMDIPAGPRWRDRGAVQMAQASVPSAAPVFPPPRPPGYSPRIERAERPARDYAPARSMQVAALPSPPRMVAPPRLGGGSRDVPRIQEVAAYAPPRHGAEQGFHLIQPAMADTIPLRKGAGGAGGGWAIQVGAYANAQIANAAVSATHGQVGGGRPAVAEVKSGHGMLYRARVTGLSHEAAVAACERVGHGRPCMVLSPDSQS